MDFGFEADSVAFCFGCLAVSAAGVSILLEFVLLIVSFYSILGSGLVYSTSGVLTGSFAAEDSSAFSALTGVLRGGSLRDSRFGGSGTGSGMGSATISSTFGGSGSGYGLGCCRWELRINGDRTSGFVPLERRAGFGAY